MKYDILDLDKSVDAITKGGRWVMHYSDGSTRRSQYRWDLIRDENNTVITKKALTAWDNWAGRVED